jgi:DNA processing protein
VDEREAALVLLTARGVGPSAAHELRRRFGSYREAVAAAARFGARALRDPLARAVRQALESGEAAEEIRLAEEAGARFVVAEDGEYPDVLAGISRAPIGVYVAGECLSELQPALAVVGTRAATRRGMAIARDLAGDAAAAGLSVVSGLARGIDTAAHEGALDAGGVTVAVFGTGLLSVYPAENAGLARRIRERGALVSELPLRQGPRAGSFPERNRIIAGLSAGVLVVEAGERSGALITAARALEEGREVFAVPGSITEPQSRGPNALIKSGAVLVESVEDIVSELESAWGPFSGAPAARGGEPGRRAESPPAAAGLGGLAGQVRALLSTEPLSVDELAQMTGAGAAELASVLFGLELAGGARQVPGGRYVDPGSRHSGRREHEGRKTRV